ncbi:adenosine deaminase 2-A isoform X5 [Phyllopteryx taeniolatus]|uniref:adenosine deaminase 2-A isoform X5 n=1 Tax=Phyllopteryx taeniolatus TaxID=161469 RepID=UPI002AD2A89B|nr:adenosine deaminase 2-A isoform X5 [Phyllopteryx taeniolatus]XP_061617626.1 adenosine deaminase 2-A isoform X5 [Phyllopteryx taeniolatus]XP_061617627.1 adenosine deaminase 2-A isoform X5 [Phyllopteryx taeniolatus]XP_061617628.1 adenosine deaminase 2-A isoform X5 [Phyllopteryx taeniolatus]
MAASLPQAAVTLLWLAAAGMPDPSQRDVLMRQEASRRTGGGVALTAAERRLDGELRRMKEREMAADPFPPAVHFFKAKGLIRDSPVFKLLQDMPKGGALHVHSSSLVSAEWLVKNATYRPHCYVCFTWDNSARFVFSRRRPYPRWDCFYWQLVSALRAKAGDAAAFDASLMKHLTLVTDDPDGEYPDQDAVWDKFERAFIAGAGLVSHAPVLRDYLLRGLHELHRDNVMYLELRSGLSRTYELDGTIHDKIWTLRTFQDVIGKFVAEHPDFLGARLIIAVHRALSASEVKAAVKEATELRRDFPDVVAGFDLVPIRVLRGTTDTARRLHNGYRISCIAGGQGGRRQAALVLPGRSVAPGPDGRHAALLLSRGRNRRGGDGDGSERSGRPAVQQQPHRARLRPGAPPARQGDVPGEAGGGGGVPHLKPGTEVGLRPAQPPGGGADGGGPPAGDQLGRPVHVRHGGPVLRLLPGLRGHRRPEGQRGHAEGAGAQLHQVQLSAADAQGLGAGRVAEEMGRLRFGSRLRARRKPFHNARWNLLSRVGPER